METTSEFRPRCDGPRERRRLWKHARARPKQRRADHGRRDGRRREHTTPVVDADRPADALPHAAAPDVHADAGDAVSHRADARADAVSHRADAGADTFTIIGTADCQLAQLGCFGSVFS